MSQQQGAEAKLIIGRPCVDVPPILLVHFAVPNQRLVNWLLAVSIRDVSAACGIEVPLKPTPIHCATIFCQLSFNRTHFFTCLNGAETFLQVVGQFFGFVARLLSKSISASCDAVASHRSNVYNSNKHWLMVKNCNC